MLVPPCGSVGPKARERGELAKHFGQLGLLGMHLEGYGCGGASAVHYGLACTEPEAADSGIRSMVSVQYSPATANRTKTAVLERN
jgi:hypothetical protein